MIPPDSKERTSVHEIRCRDRLWQTFEQMSEEQDKSVETLINDAMTGYAQIAGYETAVNALTPPPAVEGNGGRGQSHSPLPLPLPPPAFSSLPPVVPRLVRPPTGPVARAPAALAPAGRLTGRGAAPPPPPDASLAPSMLYLMFDSQKYRIDKDQFIIGRGTKSSDLPIKDGNISRKHAAVIRRNGTFFIKDLGSTNGIDFNGMRIDNKRIDEGDVFHICEYELKFTYKR
jgi:hypothetical protein